MLKHNAIIVGLASIAIVAFSAEARASCFAPRSCLCDDTGAKMNAAFTGTILEGEGNLGSTPGAFKIRIDEVTDLNTSLTNLVAGTISEDTVVGVEASVKQGDRVLGYSELTCADPGNNDCFNQPKDVEVLTLRAVFNVAGLIPCGPVVAFGSAEARELLLDPDCAFEQNERLSATQASPTCDDGGACLCSAPGGRSAGTASAALGFLALVGAWRLRRARR